MVEPRAAASLLVFCTAAAVAVLVHRQVIGRRGQAQAVPRPRLFGWLSALHVAALAGIFAVGVWLLLLG
ncbi:MAG: hypothetical protein QM767_27505 [Anaeromyxobacter sp.]